MQISSSQSMVMGLLVCSVRGSHLARVPTMLPGLKDILVAKKARNMHFTRIMETCRDIKCSIGI